MTIFRRLLDRLSPSTQPYGEPPTIASIYEAWASERRLRVHRDPEGRGLRISGVVEGRAVLVDPGLDHEVPGWVQITVAVALPSAKALLVTRATEPRDAVCAGIRALFDDRELGPELRAISVSTRHLRLRLAPGAPPDVVEAAVRAVADALRSLHGAPTSSPRQSCIITAPYPTS